jgi:hypothetical protein
VLQGIVASHIAITGGTSASDNFDRSNGGLGTNWTTMTAELSPIIYSNAAGGASDSANAAAYWNATTFTTDMCSRSTLAGNWVTTSYMGPAVRMDTSTESFYYLTNNSSFSYQMYLVSSGTSYQLGSDYSVTPALGDTLTLCVSGTNPPTFTAYINGVAQSTRTDPNNTLTTQTHAGISIWMDTVNSSAHTSLDNWSAWSGGYQ